MQNLNDGTKSRQIMANDQAIRLYKEIALLNTEQQLYILNRLFSGGSSAFAKFYFVSC